MSSKTLIKIAAIGLMAVIAGCASEPSKNYAAYVQLQQDNATAATAKATALSSSLDAQAASCNDDACKIAIAGFKALASMTGGNSTQQIAPPPAEPSAFDRTLQIVAAFTPFAADFVQYKSVVENGETSRSIAQTNATVQIANSNAWAGAVNTVASHPGTYIGGDQISNGNKIDNSGLYNTGNQNRFTSPNTGGNAGNCPTGTTGAGGAVGDGGGTGAPSGASGATTCNGGSAGG